MSQFAWVEMYEEIAAKLLDYENRQGELISLIQDMLSQGLKPISPNDRDKDGNQVLLQEIDPFTFFASFNRDITPKNRSEILAYLKQTWDLKAEVPTAFEGIPTTNNQSSWFFPYVASRKQEDIPNLWKLAWEAVTGEPEQLDQKLFDTCLQIKYSGI
ncbi:MAG: hypothetical protein K1Y36_26725 [Blastocatellia bacterium]|nr:hypothetical protein [Blastocatellia bacterium]